MKAKFEISHYYELQIESAANGLVSIHVMQNPTMEQLHPTAGCSLDGPPEIPVATMDQVMAAGHSSRWSRPLACPYCGILVVRAYAGPIQGATFDAIRDDATPWMPWIPHVHRAPTHQEVERRIVVGDYIPASQARAISSAILAAATESQHGTNMPLRAGEGR